MTENLLIKTIVKAIEDKKGENIVVIDLCKTNNSVCDFFVICHAESTRQVDAIADNTEKIVRNDMKLKVLHKEGFGTAQWIILDYAEVVVHVFQEEYRELYKLEELWGDGTIFKLNN